MSVATQIAAIEAAIEKGALEVEDENGRRVRYHSLDLMIAALSRLKANQAGSSTAFGMGFRKIIPHGSVR